MSEESAHFKYTEPRHFLYRINFVLEMRARLPLAYQVSARAGCEYDRLEINILVAEVAAFLELARIFTCCTVRSSLITKPRTCLGGTGFQTCISHWFSASGQTRVGEKKSTTKITIQARILPFFYLFIQFRYSIPGP